MLQSTRNKEGEEKVSIDADIYGVLCLQQLNLLNGEEHAVEASVSPTHASAAYFFIS